VEFTMKIKFLGPIDSPPDDVIVQVEQEFGRGSVRDLLGRLGFPAEQAWFLSVFADDERLAPDDIVSADAQVTIMLLVGGG